METKLKVKEKTPMRYILENGCLIEDTFAEMFPMLATSPTVHPLFSAISVLDVGVGYFVTLSVYV